MENYNKTFSYWYLVAHPWSLALPLLHLWPLAEMNWWGNDNCDKIGIHNGGYWRRSLRVEPGGNLRPLEAGLGNQVLAFQNNLQWFWDFHSVTGKLYCWWYMWLVWRPIRFRGKENKAGLRILQTKIILPWILLNGLKVLEIYSWRFFIFNGI